jgi:hypothetical protein
MLDTCKIIKGSFYVFENSFIIKQVLFEREKTVII